MNQSIEIPSIESGSFESSQPEKEADLLSGLIKEEHEQTLNVQAEPAEIEVKVPIKFLIQLALGGNINDGKVPADISKWAQELCSKENLYPMVTENLYWQLDALNNALVNLSQGNHGIYKNQIAAMVDNFAKETRDALLGTYEDPNKIHITNQSKIKN